MNTRAAAVPRWVRIVVLVLGLLNLAYAVMGYLSTSVLFPDLTGTRLAPESPILVHASRELSARNLAISLAVLIVSRVGVPESIAIVTIIRAVTEVQTIVLGVMAGISSATLVPSLVLPAVLLAVEVVIVRSMVRLVGRLEANATESR